MFNNLENPVFLKEESDTREYISKLEALLPQASGRLKNKIEQEIKLASIGEYGENNIAFELKNSGIPMYVLRDIHLETGELSAQIDYIVITRKVTFVIECKNLIGNIEIDNKGNFIRKYELNGKPIREGIYSPLTQNKRHLEVLRQIKKNERSNRFTKMIFDKYFDDNYKSIVVLANPKTILNAKYAPKGIKELVIRADQLNHYIKDVNNKSKQPAFNDRKMKEFAEGLLTLHIPKEADYPKKYEKFVESITRIKDEAAEKEVESKKPRGKNDIHLNEELIKALKGFRTEISREENIKPYYIFNDKQLMDLIDKMPGSKEALLKVSGFGELKVEKYGDRILELLNDFENPDGYFRSKK